MKNTKAFAEKVWQLKKLRVKDREKYAVMKEEVMEEFGVSQATLYRQMGKRVPGKRKTRNDRGKEKKPVSRKAKEIVTEVMLAGKKKKDALKKAEEITGQKISSVKAVNIEKGVAIDKTNFGSAAKEFIRKILELDMISPEAGLYFKHKGLAFKVRKEYIEDIALILATAYNECLKGEDMLKVDREQMMRSQIFHLVQEAIRLASLDFDMKLVTQLTKMYKDLQEKSGYMYEPDFEVFEKCLKHVKPDITKSECIALVKKYSM